MKLGKFRKLTEGLPDSAEIILWQIDPAEDLCEGSDKLYITVDQNVNLSLDFLSDRPLPLAFLEPF